MLLLYAMLDMPADPLHGPDCYADPPNEQTRLHHRTR
jgi:hypothetical protein